MNGSIDYTAFALNCTSVTAVAIGAERKVSQCRPQGLTQSNCESKARRRGSPWIKGDNFPHLLVGVIEGYFPVCGEFDKCTVVQPLKNVTCSSILQHATILLANAHDS